MKEFKILTISSREELPKAMEHLKGFFEPLGAKIDLHHEKTEDPAAVADLVKKHAPLDAVRIDPDLSRAWTKQCAVQSLAVSRIGVGDTFLCRRGKWEPELILQLAVREVLVRFGRTLDLNASAYVIGHGVILEIIGGVCAGIGFRKITLVDEGDSVQPDTVKADLEHAFSGVEVTPLPSHQMTLQTVGSSLIINCFDLAKYPELSADLSYFNFMTKDGVVLDLIGAPGNEPMLEEAKRAGLRVLPLGETDGMANWLFAEHLGISKLTSIENYLRDWSTGR